MLVLFIYNLKVIDSHVDLAIILDEYVGSVLIFMMSIHDIEHLHLGAILEDSLLDMIDPLLSVLFLFAFDDLVEQH